MYQVRKINSLNCIHSFLCDKRASDSHQVQPCSWYYMVPLVPPGQMLRIGYIFFSLIFVFFYQTKYCKNGTSHSFSITTGIALHLSGTPRAGISLLFQPQQPAQSFTPFKKNKMQAVVRNTNLMSYASLVFSMQKSKPCHMCAILHLSDSFVTRLSN